ncbi:MAG TPA: hypothetical protein VGB14_13365 [Acidimicrobiales bacterium]|jgi:ribosomal protein S27AE
MTDAAGGSVTPTEQAVADVVGRLGVMDLIRLLDKSHDLYPAPRCPHCPARSHNALIVVHDDGVRWTCQGCGSSGTIYELRRRVLEDEKAVAQLARIGTKTHPAA